MSVRPTKTQISVGIDPVWSESSLSAWRKFGSLATHWVHSEDWIFAQGIQSFCWFCHVAAHMALYYPAWCISRQGKNEIGKGKNEINYKSCRRQNILRGKDAHCILNEGEERAERCLINKEEKQICQTLCLLSHVLSASRDEISQKHDRSFSSRLWYCID